MDTTPDGRLRKKTPEIKEIIITGYPSIENAVQPVNDGADAYLIKPADLLAKLSEKLKT